MDKKTFERILRYVRSVFRDETCDEYSMAFGYLKGSERNAFDSSTIAAFKNRGFEVSMSVPGYTTFTKA